MRLISKWSTQQHEFVTERSFGFRVAAIKGLSPNECCRLRRHPLVVARASQHAFNWNVVRQWQVGNFVLQPSGEVPDFDFARKVTLRHDVGIWMLDANDEQVLAVRRRLYAGKDCRLADPGASVDVNARMDGADVADMRKTDAGQLRRGVVVKQVFIVPIFEQIFICADGGFLAVALLNDGAVRRFWFCGRISAAAGDGLDEECFAVGHPLQGITKDGADLEALK